MKSKTNKLKQIDNELNRIECEFNNMLSVCYVLSLVMAVMFVAFAIRANIPDANSFPPKTMCYEVIESVESAIQNEGVATEYAYYPNEEIVLPDEAEIEMLARLVYGEARGLDAYEQSLVCFCVFNRVDDSRFPNSISEVITQSKPCVQFDGYSSSHPITEEIHDVVVEAWNTWANGLENPLPSRFVYFRAENGHNQFYTNWKGGEKFAL